VLPDDQDARVFEALRRECGSIAQHLGIGATAIGSADFERTASYAQAFFALTVGFERGCKLVLSLDAAINSGQFLDARALRRYGHDLIMLLARVDQISATRGFGVSAPQSDIQTAILDVLTAFAKNVTRYFNLEVLSSAGTAAADPIATWYRTVTVPVLAKHRSDQRRRRDEARIRQIAVPASMLVSVLGWSETGEPLRSLDVLMRRKIEAELARRWERMYVLQLARFVTNVIGRIGSEAQTKGLQVPFMHEYFTGFQAEDREFRNRKAWLLER
jgi:hypothetical protein